MQTSVTHGPERRTQGRRGLAPVVAGTLVLASLWAGSSAWANETVDPVPDAPLAVDTAPPAVPEQVQAAISALSRACAAWPLPLPYGGVMPPGPPMTAMPQSWPTERELCQVVANPKSSFSQLLWFGGALGAAALAFGLVGFCFLRALLLNLWHWRPRSAVGPR